MNKKEITKKISLFFSRNQIYLLFLLVLIVLLSVFNEFYQILVIRKELNDSSYPEEKNITSIQENKNIPLDFFDIDLNKLDENDLFAVSAFLRFRKVRDLFVPSGIPEVYGKELDISFDSVQRSMNTVALLDPTYGSEKINLSGSDFERYKNIAMKTSCKYCCGVKALIFENGVAACGCAHSQMMRGLAAYLIKNHPELTDQEILRELNVWRASYFPKQILSEAFIQMENQGISGIENILNEFPEFLPQMVGNC